MNVSRIQLLMAAVALSGLAACQSTPPAEPPPAPAPVAEPEPAPVQAEPAAPAAPQVVTLRDAQERLNAMGINVGTPDGKAGPRTRAGLRKFQKDHGLYQSGTLDQPTKNALNQPQ